MSLALDVSRVEQVLLMDGWHRVANASFELDAYEFIHAERNRGPTHAHPVHGREVDRARRLGGGVSRHRDLGGEEELSLIRGVPGSIPLTRVDPSIPLGPPWIV